MTSRQYIKARQINNNGKHRQDKNICNRYVMLLQANSPHGQYDENADRVPIRNNLRLAASMGSSVQFPAIQNLVDSHIPMKVIFL